MEDDIVTKFWKKYIDADCMERDELFKNLPFVKEFLSGKIDTVIKDKKAYEHLFVLGFKSYVDDLIDYMYEVK